MSSTPPSPSVPAYVARPYPHAAVGGGEGRGVRAYEVTRQRYRSRGDLRHGTGRWPGWLDGPHGTRPDWSTNFSNLTTNLTTSPLSHHLHYQKQ